MHKELSHQIIVEKPLAEAMGLFTPKGEEAWVPGWKPHYLTPASGETCKEMLFTTTHDGETTIWTCMDWQPEAGHARYFRVTPESRISFVDVQCQALDAHRTKALVTYQMHALTPAGEAYIQEITQNAFNDMIDHWAELIRNMDT